MSEPGERCVCDMTLVVRTRLLCGLYNRRAVPPRWRRLAQAYSLALAIALLNYTYFILWKILPIPVFLHWFMIILDYIVAILISLWTGDEYVNTYFTLNEITDITLDSQLIFNRLQKQIKKTFIFAVLPYAVVHLGIYILTGYSAYTIVLMILFVPTVIIEVCEISGSSTKLLIMALFNARLLVLKRRLLRYGFRTVGLRQPQPYCQIYDKVLQGLKATDNPLKTMLACSFELHIIFKTGYLLYALSGCIVIGNSTRRIELHMLFFDLIFTCCKIILYLLIVIFFLQIQDKTSIHFLLLLSYCTTLTKLIICSFGHVTLLESAAAHCEDMAVFTATQLIKTPTAEERQRIRSFLTTLECSDARYRVLRALTLDARLVLAVLSFCSAQVIVLVKTVAPD